MNYTTQHNNETEQNCSKNRDVNKINKKDDFDSDDTFYKILINETPLLGDLVKIIIGYDNEPKIKGELEKTISLSGSYSTHLLGPWGIATDDTYIYVSDGCNHRIQFIDTNGTLVGSWGQKGTGDKRLKFPRDLAIYKSRLYIVDSQNQAIKIISVPDRTFIKKFEYGDDKISAGKICVYKSCIYLTHPSSQCISVFTLDGTRKSTINSWDILRGTGICKPSGLFISDDEIYVTCLETNTVVCLSINGKYQFHMNGLDNKGIKFNGPDSVYITDRSIYVTDINGVHHFNRNDRKFVKRFGGCKGIKGMAFLNNRCYITDWYSDRILVFQ